MMSLPGERLLYESPTGKLKITTHRVRYERQSGSTATIKSIMLEEVASCSMIRKTYPWLLIFAAICFLGGLLLAFSGWMAGLVFGLILAVILGFAYLLSREQVVAIASGGTTIFVNTQVWASNDVRELIEKVEAAKNARYLVVRVQPAAVVRT